MAYMFLARVSHTFLHLSLLEEVLKNNEVFIVKGLIMNVVFMVFSSQYCYLFSCLALIQILPLTSFFYLFHSVIIVVSGDVVRSPLRDKYTNISAENPDAWFLQSQYIK